MEHEMETREYIGVIGSISGEWKRKWKLPIWSLAVKGLGVEG